MTWQETISFLTGCMPRPVGRALMQQQEGSVREIRVRAGGKVRILTAGGEITCACTPTQPQVEQMAEALCEHALYARAEEQRQGFVTLRGGHRMGLCGRVVAQGQSVRALRDISSLCLRVAGQWRGAADALMPHLWDEQGRVRSLLIVGLPGMGKTTMLRDACRRLSERGARMCVVDERSEIAAMSGGVPQLDVGPNTDVLDGCAKEAGLRWMLRAMSPQVLVSDEIGNAQDAEALLDAQRCGVKVLCSAHGASYAEVQARSCVRQLLRESVFDRVLLLGREPGRIAAVYDREGRPCSD